MSEASADHRAWCPKERDYIGMSDASSCSYAQLMKGPEQAEGTSEETELRLDLGLGLGLSTILSKREGEGEPKESHPSSLPLESSHAASVAGAGSCASKNWMKRAFSEAMAASVKNSDPDTRKQQSCASIWALSNANGPSWQRASLATTLKGPSLAPLDNARAPAADGASPAKDRVVGWPPVRSYRRQSLAKPVELFVKVNMDGITVGRKVDLNAYNSYVSLQRALEEMFQPAVSGNNREQDVKHFLLASDQEFVLTYEDKDGDWMLVGDVPWSLFVSSVRRLRITRTVEATGVGSDV